MKFSIRLFPEITIKSRPVRKRLIQRLQSNLQNMTRRIDEQIKVRGHWDKLDVVCVKVRMLMSLRRWLILCSVRRVSIALWK